MRHPPYLRWIAAALLVVGAAAWEVQKTAGVAHPFARHAISASTPLTIADISWRRVPSGLLPMPNLDGVTAAHDLAAGEALAPSSVSTHRPVPEDWWAVPASLPPGSAIGDRVRLVVIEPPASFDGIIAAPSSEDSFGFDATGLVAVHPSDAVAAAAAAANGTLLVLVAP